ASDLVPATPPGFYRLRLARLTELDGISHLIAVIESLSLVHPLRELSHLRCYPSPMSENPLVNSLRVFLAKLWLSNAAFRLVADTHIGLVRADDSSRSPPWTLGN